MNDVRLSPQLLADLFGNVLVETLAATQPDANLKTIGDNKKNILIVVQQDSDSVLPEPELQFLTSVLTACKLRLGDVIIMNWAQRGDRDYKTLLHDLESRFILLFGLSPLAFGLPMDFPPFQVQAFDSRQYLYAPALQKIQAHKGIKTELWNALKKMFLLS